MKTILLLSLALLTVTLLTSCTTAQMGNTAPVIDSLINTALSTYASQYGVPPTLTTAIADKLEASAWGMALSTYTGAAPATGADPALAAVAAAIQAKLPTNISADSKAVILEDMATKLAALPTK